MKNEYKIIEEKQQLTSDEKIKWFGYGEWVEEADTVMLEYRGFHALINRVFTEEPCCPVETYFGGHLCGYVRIPENHPYFRNKDISVECHYGLSFNETNEEWIGEHWIGFDCGHSGDLIPTMELSRKRKEADGEFEPVPIPKIFQGFSLFNPVYRNMKYCIDICVQMIDELADLATVEANETNV